MKQPLSFFSLLLSLLLTVGAVAPQKSGDDFTAALIEARTLLSEGKPKDAIARLQPLAQSDDVRIRHLLGMAYYHANDLLRAIEFLTLALDKLPKDSREQREAVQSLSLAHYLLNHLAEAIPFLEQTIAWQPNNNELAYALGMAAIQTRQPDKARAAFAQMFRVAPESAAAHLLTAQFMIRVEFEDFADAELKRALEKDPRLPQANYLLAQTAIYKGRYDEGIALLEKELSINPNNAMAHYKIGDALTRQLKWDEAISALQKSVWLNPFFSGPYILLGKSYLKKKQLPTAEGMLKRAIQMDPNNKSAHYMLGQVYQQSGRSEDAKREFAIAEKLQGSQESPENR